jgi:drug/metabolite transporter (DMT)-like permease
MAILLAILSSLGFGHADFLGGLATRRAAAVSVVVTGHTVGLAVVTVAAPLWGSEGGVLGGMLWGAAAGASGVLGLVTLYHALATTRFNIVAPVTALVGAIVPVGYGLVIGERPEVLAWMGVGLALPALLLITTRRGSSGRSDVVVRAAWFGALAGLLFALFGILISNTTEASGLWPLVGARLASLPTVGALALATRRPLLAGGGALRAALAAGFLDMLSNIALLLALQRGLVSLVILISSLYPAFTVVLARVVLHERLTRLQLGGLLLAGAGVALITVA